MDTLARRPDAVSVAVFCLGTTDGRDRGGDVTCKVEEGLHVVLFNHVRFRLYVELWKL